MWPCCDITSSDDDEHNTDNNFLLLFADIDITPTWLEGLTEVDVLHIALGCRFALDMFTISQQLPHDPEFATFRALAPHKHYVCHVGQLAWTTFITIFLHNACT